jgi:hypothetical protein
MIAAIDRLAHSFADDNSPRTKVGAENANASDLRVRRDPPDHPCHSGAMTIDIAAIARFDFNLNARVDYMQIVQEREAREGRMIDFHSRIDDCDAHTFARALFQSAARFVQAKRGGLWG